jgi:hypothetical protein
MVAESKSDFQLGKIRGDFQIPAARRETSMQKALSGSGIHIIRELY